jgi:hypothetical protein
LCSPRTVCFTSPREPNTRMLWNITSYITWEPAMQSAFIATEPAFYG